MGPLARSRSYSLCREPAVGTAALDVCGGEDSMTARLITIQNPRVTAEFIDNLRESDVIVCRFDDGGHVIAKGTELLDEVIRTNQAVESRFLFVPVTNIEEAEVIASRSKTDRCRSNARRRHREVRTDVV
jgi:hypothetical protein